MTPALAVRDLTVRFPLPGRRRAPRRVVHAATDVSFDLHAGRVLALVGESGCGKSVLASALLRLLPGNAVVTGSAVLGGSTPVDVLTADERVVGREVRGRRVALVPQSAATSLTPVRTARSQLEETVRELTPGVDPRARADELADRVGLAPHQLDLFSHELSGGMAQRVVVALALAGDPAVVLADEPTAGLDRPLADRTLQLLRTVADAGCAVLLITHDLGGLLRAPEVADDLAVMYASRLMETGPAAAVLAAPAHDYTRDLLGALPAGGLVPIPGHPPELTDLPAGCAYHARRPEAGRCDGGALHGGGLRSARCRPLAVTSC